MREKVSSVFWSTLVISLIMVIWGAISPDTLGSMSASAQSFISNKLGWYYLILVTLLVVFCIFIIFTPYGKIKLGKPDEKPEFTRLSWFAMLFSAGMGIGLVFWGTAEPMSHYAVNAPTAETGTPAAIKEALQYSYFHWGVHAWAIYAIVALVLAYFKFRHDRPGLISATLYPIFGDRVNGLLGKVIDTLAVFATIVGVATTLGFGAVQINGGLSFLTDIPNSFGSQLVIIGVVTVLFMISAWSGIGKGIKYLSNANLGLAGILFLAMFILGPTIYILNMFTDTIGAYITNFMAMSFRIAPLNPENREWINNWTIFYWAWWISWSPFVGIFIARVSRGRTIREFLVGVLLVPSVVGFLWFSTFGISGINLQQNGIADIASLATEESLFGTLQNYPLGTVLSIVAITLIGTFFITSADSATFVLGMQTTYGSLNPGANVKLTWGIIQSAMAAVLLYTGGLQALQNVLILAALPFSIIMILMTVSFYKAIQKEKYLVAKDPKPKKEKRKEKKAGVDQNDNPSPATK